MASIREVAKLAQVSPATVSRVMNGTAKVDEQKKRRVLEAIEETGFVPNEVARSLFKKSAKLIGLILPSIENPFFAQLAGAIERKADKHGYRLVLCNTGSNVEKERAAMQMLMSMNADGIILTTSNDEIREYTAKCNIPVIVTDRSFSGSDALKYVHCNHYQGGRMAAEHLISCGCKNIVCIKGPQEISSAKDRYQGYKDICQEKGIKEQTMECAYDFNEGMRVTEKLLEEYKDVDGIIACNDMVAISAYKVLIRNNIQVPKQVKLIGFDDIALSKLMTPALTTISQPVEEIGAKAAELIIFRDESTKQEYIYEAKLVERETTR
ncbi:MAG: LacI family DNA-binding transcriptional regulator [Lachnospiraceae bacterium]|nr:LacI family DNA-binding transcriptional regulator [Lachnospiraceae bacterium]